MLARYLHATLPRVRYAVQRTPPEHAEAMRNFLALHTRAFDLPHLLGQAGGRLGHPLLQSFLQSILGEHDYQSIGPFLDVHQDEGGPRPSPALPFSGTSWAEHIPEDQRAHHTLIDVLAGLHALMTGQREHVTGMRHSIPSPAEIHRRYGTEALQGRGIVGPVASLAHLMAMLQPGDPRWHPLRASVDEGAGDFMLHVPAYDAAQQLSTPGVFAPLRAAAGRAREAITQHLRTGILPHLHEGLS